jgi:cell division protein FtsL
MTKDEIPATPFIITILVGILLLIISFAIGEKQKSIDELNEKIKHQEQQIQLFKMQIQLLENRIK